MKHFKFISLLSIVFAFSAAQAETKVNGELWTSFGMVMDNGATGGNDRITPMGFNLERARIVVGHSFNDNWSAELSIAGDDVTGNNTVGANNNPTVSLNRAYITGKDWLADGHTLMVGMLKNAFEREYDKSHRFWIHRSAARTIAGIVTAAQSATADENLFNYGGLNYNIMFNDMWALELSLNNGPTTTIVNGGTTGSSHDVTGYGAYLMGKINDNFSIALGYDTHGTGKNNTSDSGADNVNGTDVMRATLDYTSDMLDAGFEYVNFDSSAATGTDAESLGAMALHLDWKYQEDRSVYAWYMMTDGFEASDFGSAVNQELESIYKVGHVWTLSEGIDTGLFYEAVTRNTDDNDENGVYWRWAANF